MARFSIRTRLYEEGGVDIKLEMIRSYSPENLDAGTEEAALLAKEIGKEVAEMFLLALNRDKRNAVRST